ncbi:MAG: class I tRNA ligase family protein, partial [Gemmataceae bacterium]
MAFEKVETQAVDFPGFERQILALWDAQQIFAERKKRNAGRPRWSFLDGPITANNPMGVHHAWNRTYKDVYNRYFAMTGHDLRYQQGFDCQGLWVEVEVEKELKLESKRDIENLVPGDREASIAKFVQACKDRVNKYARMQTEQSIRLGYWMNWDRTDADWAKPPGARQSYFTMAEENNFTIWDFLKKCHDQKLVYRGYDAMPWCGRCGVGISEQEKAEGYKLIEHRAAFVKFPLLDRPNEHLLAWTTTPWTLTSNVGAAVNPKLTYLRVKLKDEVYYVAKGVFKANRMEGSGGGGSGENDDEPTAKKSKRDWLPDVPHLKSIEQLFKEKAGKDGFTIDGEVTGQQMLGWRYAGPFDDLPAQNSPFGFPDEVAKIVKTNGWCNGDTGIAAHRIIDGGDDVTEGEGTGIVHTAPGCGGIDFQWGKANGLPPIAPLGEDGCFHDGFGPLAGKNAAEHSTADVVFEELKKKDRLFAIERYVHKYPHCWRCKKELLYRLVDEWFIDMGPRNTEEGFRGRIMRVSEQVTFLPESLNGRARERDWLWNMGDWMISKKRYWGLALPIWVDEKDPTQFEVIGSREELQARAVAGWEEFDGN